MADIGPKNFLHWVLTWTTRGLDSAQDPAFRGWMEKALEDCGWERLPESGGVKQNTIAKTDLVPRPAPDKMESEKQRLEKELTTALQAASEGEVDTMKGLAGFHILLAEEWHVFSLGEGLPAEGGEGDGDGGEGEGGEGDT